MTTTDSASTFVFYIDEPHRVVWMDRKGKTIAEEVMTGPHGGSVPDLRGLAERKSCFLHGDYSEPDCPGCRRIGRPEPTLARRLGWMADAILSARIGTTSRFYSRERVDEIVLLLREAEKATLAAGQASAVPLTPTSDEIRAGICTGCGVSKALCLEYRLHGNVCCPDCSHGKKAEASGVPQWLPINTAPKDRELLGWFPYYASAERGGSVFVMRWNTDEYAKTPRPFWDASGWVWGIRDQRGKQPTHFQHLPDPPGATDTLKDQ